VVGGIALVYFGVGTIIVSVIRRKCQIPFQGFWREFGLSLSWIFNCCRYECAETKDVVAETDYIPMTEPLYRHHVKDIDYTHYCPA
jgi:hypothetical protein